MYVDFCLTVKGNNIIKKHFVQGFALRCRCHAFRYENKFSIVWHAINPGTSCWQNSI